MDAPHYDFDFFISFAGRQRHIAEQLAEALRKRNCRVFYDGLFRSSLLGKRLDKYFRQVLVRTRFLVPIISNDYNIGIWPKFEWNAAMNERATRSHEYILPLRYDATLLVGLEGEIGYLDLHKQTIDEVANILKEKLNEQEKVTLVPHGPEVWIATFGLTIDDLLESNLLPATAPSDYPRLCDWLEVDLLERLKEASVSEVYMPEASERSGESLSIHIAFTWLPNEASLSFGDLEWWELLELAPIGEIYDASE